MAKRGGEGSEDKKKTCFVICPIGKENSERRQWSDDVLDLIITPVVEEMGYDTPIRADGINESGIITSQIVNLLVESDLVIADLSFGNPNVFYELAVRHVTKKPCIHMISTKDENPFDTSSNRAIVFDLNMRGGMKAKEALKEQIEAIKKGKLETDNPIGTALTLRDLKSSGNTQQYNMGLVLEEMREIRNEIRAQQESLSKSEMMNDFCFDFRDHRLKEIQGGLRVRRTLDSLHYILENPEFSQIVDLKSRIDNMRKNGISESDNEMQKMIKQYNKILKYILKENADVG